MKGIFQHSYVIIEAFLPPYPPPWTFLLHRIPLISNIFLLRSTPPPPPIVGIGTMMMTIAPTPLLRVYRKGGK